MEINRIVGIIKDTGRTEVCYLCSAFDAFNRDFKVIFLSDCTAGESEEIERAVFYTVNIHLGWVMSSLEER